jgi:hypothetical protein
LAAAIRLTLWPVVEANVIQRPFNRPLSEDVTEQLPLEKMRVPVSGNWPAEFGVVDWVRTMLAVPTASGPEPEPAGLGYTEPAKVPVREALGAVAAWAPVTGPCQAT